MTEEPGEPSFNEDHFREVEKYADEVITFFQALFQDIPPKLPVIESCLPKLYERINADKTVANWLTITLADPGMNQYGPGLGQPLTPARARLAHLIHIGLILFPGIATLTATRNNARSTASGMAVSGYAGGDTVFNAAAPLVSIIIVAWNGWSDTLECIKSIFTQMSITAFEIIIVDNGSTDQTKQSLPQLAACSSLLRAVRSEVNLGFSAGNNLGVTEARGKYLLFLNNDTIILESTWLRRMVDAIESSAQIGAAGQFGVIDLEGEFPAPNFFYQKVFLPGVTLPVAWLSGFCLMMRREAFAAVGGWRADLYGKAGYEDIHMGYALRKAGWLAVVPPRWVPIFHKIGQTRGKENVVKELASGDVAPATKEERFRLHFGRRKRNNNYALPI